MSAEREGKLQLNNEKEKSKEKIDRRPKRKKPGFHEEMFEETKYYFKKGLRFVYPYPFTFTAHIKKRWLNLKLIGLFEREFHMETLEYYENAIKIGKVKVNDEIVTRDRILTGKDILKTIVHRHEPPVLHEELEFLQNDNDMVVINKPSSIPVHPCGRYRHNTIVFILGKEYGLDRLHTIHRIDRLTSGILMFAKNAEKAKEMEAAVHGRNVEKEYMARVVGDFPSKETVVDEPLLTMSHKIGVCQVHNDGKPCITVFNKINYNGKSSLVRCRPHTGRMHQIRVHLQWLGHPIVNDPIYNHKTAWGEGKGKKGTTIDVKQVVAELIRTRKDKSYDDENNIVGDDSKNVRIDTEMEKEQCSKKPKLDTTCETTNPTNNKNSTVDDILCDSVESRGENTKVNSVSNTDVTSCSTIEKGVENNGINSKEESEEEVESYTSLDIGEEYHDPSCTECKRSWKEPRKSELVMYLHALSYKGPGFQYTASLPKWAQDSWIKD